MYRDPGLVGLLALGVPVSISVVPATAGDESPSAGEETAAAAGVLGTSTVYDAHGDFRAGGAVRERARAVELAPQEPVRVPSTAEVIGLLRHRGHMDEIRDEPSRARALVGSLLREAGTLERVAERLRIRARVLREQATSTAERTIGRGLSLQVRNEDFGGYAAYLARQATVRILRECMGRSLEESMREQADTGG